jgi:FAD/FMN-containing dehydrogenase
MRSGAITGPGMTASARSRSRPPCGRRAAKAALDPAGILNPGVLIDPAR